MRTSTGPGVRLDSGDGDACDPESFGGPDDVARSVGGFGYLIDVPEASEAQRRPFVEPYWLLRTR